MRSAPLWLLLLSACDPASITVGGTDPSEAGPDAPVARITAADPSHAEAGRPLDLDGSASTDSPGYEIVDYSWACTDGSLATGPVVSFSFAAAGPVGCTLTVLSSSGLSGEASQDLEVGPHRASWTVIIYVNGDNNLEDAALGDLNEMEQVGSTDEVNIVVQLDRSPRYTRADGDWSGARRYLVQADDDTSASSSTVLEDLGKVDSGDADVVAEFGAWAVANFPAHHYAMVLWNHGSGWYLMPDDEPATTKGISWDESTNSEMNITDGDLDTVLDAAVKAAGAPLDLVGMDACIMGSWEIAHVVAPYSAVYVSSQDYESDDGWAYDTFLADLVADPSLDAAGLGESIALRFNESRDSTQSAADLSALPPFESALDTLATAMIDNGDPKGQLKLGAGDAQEFDGGYGSDHDIGDFLELLSASSEDQAVISAAQDALAAYQGLIISNYTNGRGAADATGLSIYSPTRGRIDRRYYDGSWADDTLWDDLIKAVNAE